jgi:cation:H+ antiporter
LDLLLFALGLLLLVGGAEFLVRGASRLALTLGLSPLVVGLTVVAFGTSAPELAVSIGAATRGAADVAVGNVVGSNIFNILLILGASAMITPLAVNGQILRQEIPFLIGASLLMTLLAQDGTVGRAEGLLLTALLAGYTTILIRQSRRESKTVAAEYEEGVTPRSQWDRNLPAQLLLIVGGLAMLVFGADLLVQSATGFARAMGVSDVVIGLTIVAAGTSLPEVAASLMAAFRGERDIAVGNVIGSNLFNILGCIGVTGAIADGGLRAPDSVLAFDLWFMVAVAVLTLPVCFTGRRIARWEGFFFVAGYVAYAAWCVLSATQHSALPTYRSALLYVAAPATLLLLAASLWPRRGTRHA